MTRTWHALRDHTLALMAYVLMGTIIWTCTWLARTWHAWHTLHSKQLKHVDTQAN